MEETSLISIDLRAELTELYRLTGCVEAFAEAHALRPADANALTLAAEELFANTVKHSHPAAHGVEFSLALGDGVVTGFYADDGAAFDPTVVAAPDTTLGAELRPIGGLGIYFIRRTMERFGYARVDGWNRVEFVRRLTV